MLVYQRVRCNILQLSWAPCNNSFFCARISSRIGIIGKPGRNYRELSICLWRMFKTTFFFWQHPRLNQSISNGCILHFSPKQLLSWMGFSILARNGLCSIMICWLLLVPAGVPVLVSLILSSSVPVLVSLLLSSFFPQERGSVPSWFAGSSWFRLGFRCLSPFFSLLSFLRKGVPFHHDLLVSSWFRLGFRCLSPFFSLLWFRCLSPFFSLLSFLRKGVPFHHDLLAPPGSGWGSGACLPSSLFFGSSACLPSSLFFLSSGQGSVPSWFAGSSWFRLGFRCLSPFFSLLSFLRKEVLFHHDLLVPLGSGWGSGACLPSSLFFGSGACLPFSLFFPQERGSVPSWFAGSSWFRLGFRCLFPFSLLWFQCLPSSLFRFSSGQGSVPSWFAGSSWFRLGFRCLSPFFFLFFLRKGVLCHHDLLVNLLVPAGVPVLVSLLLSSLVPVLVSLLLSSFFPQERGSVPSWFAGSSWFRLGFRCLSPFFSLLSFLRKGFCSIMICWFLLVPAGVPVLFFLLLSSLVPVLVSLLLSCFFPQDRGSVPSWFAGSSWFRLGFRCLSPFFSLISFLRKGVLFHHDLLVSLGSGWGSGACLPSSPFFLSSGKRFCSIMICWFLLVPGGVPVLVSLLLSSLVSLPFSLLSSFFPQERGFCSIMICWFFVVPAGVPVLVSFILSSLVPVLVSFLVSCFFSQERGSVPSWFAGSSWFRLGFLCLSPLFSLLWFRCLSPFLSLLSFLRKGVLFHHDLLVPPGSGWGSGACLLSSLFFLSSGKGSVPSWFAGSSWFRLGFRCFSSFFSLLWFRCLSPFFSLLSFLRKGVLFHHDSGWGSGACLLFLSSFFPQEILSPFFSLLSFLRKGVLFHHDLLVPPGSGWGSGACLPSLFFVSSGKGVLFHHDLLVPLGSGWGSGACLPSSLFFGSGACLPSSLFFGSGACLPLLSSFLSSGKGFCSIMICWFLLVPGWGSGACLLSSLFFLSSGQRFCSIMICWFLLVPAGVPVLVSLLLSPFFPQERGSVPSWFAGSSLFRLGFRCLSPFFSLLWFRCLSPFFSLLCFLRKGVLFHHDLLVLLGSGWGSGACLPSSLFFGSGACLPSSLFFLFSGKGFCSIMICWFFLVPAGVPVLVSLLLSSLVPVLVSLLLSSFFSPERGSVPSWFAGSS